MSKYQQRGPYHFVEYANKDSTYAKHVDDLLTQLQKHIGVGKQLSAYEVGCGEGLILHLLQEQLGWLCRGSEIDAKAVEMGRRLNLSTIFDYASTPPHEMVRDVAMFCDSLEHIEDPLKMIAWAKNAKWIVIAIPSQHDRHAINEFSEKSFDPILSEWGTCVHRATRHARHLTIWKRNA